jgi:hypothetical protein
MPDWPGLRIADGLGEQSCLVDQAGFLAQRLRLRASASRMRCHAGRPAAALELRNGRCDFRMVE